ncbi:MAG: DUF4445 domain-containing protein [Chloroflexi bacterium]|nr:DUF4445 domain-containing protein [Chloroflexota bacterium]
MPKSASPDLIQVDWEPIGKRVQIEAGKTLLAASQEAGIELISICGGIASCDSCKVKLISGVLSVPEFDETNMLYEDEIDSGIRLACQAVPLEDVRIYVPAESLTTPQRLQVEGQSVEIEIDPVIKVVEVKMDEPSLTDLRADAKRLKDALEAEGLNPESARISILKNLPEQLRSQEWSASAVVRHEEIISILPPKSKLFGVAVDIGTTKLAAYLVDLENGETIAKVGDMNPQIAYGEDVISRIAYTNENKNGGKVLQESLVESLNGLFETLCTETKITTDQVVEVVAVGNTAMHHIFAGLPVKQLGRSPYVPAVSEAIDIRANEIGLRIAPGGYVHLPPNIAGYVGSDHVAIYLATDLWKEDRVVVALDIGTNTEITLAAGGKLLSCSCASGPAFEGAHIHDGMRAAPGAIERVQIEADEVRYQTIANQPPVGICGSGILDIVAELRKAEIVDKRGGLRKDHPKVRKNGKVPEYLLIGADETGHGRDIIVTRKDINEIQLAKAAIRAGVEILFNRANISAEDVDEFIIAGAFGTYIDVVNGIRVGIFPDIPITRFKQIGNAAGVGAKQMLISQKRRRIAGEIRDQVDYIELTTDKSFQKEFMKAMYL